MRQGKKRWLFAIVLALAWLPLTAMSTGVAIPQALAMGQRPRCEPMPLQVALASGEPQKYTIFGSPCQPERATDTIASDTFALHQVVQALRNGTFGEKFSRVILAGHSLGGYMAWAAGKSYPQDFDAFMITGAVHPNSQSATNMVIPLLAPAVQNPKFAHSGLDSGYYAYKPDTRKLYYYLKNVDPKVIARDNQLMQVTVLQELIDGIGLQSTFVSRSIHVPVFDVLGQYDLFGCEPDAINPCTTQTVYQAEAPYYAPQACLQVDVIPNAGHDLNLQENARVWYTDAAKWIGSTVVNHADASCGTRNRNSTR